MDKFKEIPSDQMPVSKGAPVRAFKSSDFLVQIFKEEGKPTRITVNKTKRKGKTWADGITWDELMHIKRLVGFHNQCAVEIYPADKDIVNVSNMRHLWLVDMPDYAWKSDEVAA